MEILSPLQTAPPFDIEADGGIRNVTIVVRNQFPSAIANCINAILAYDSGSIISVVSDGGNRAPTYAPLLASMGIKFTPHLRYKSCYGGMLAYVQRLVNSLLSGETFPNTLVVVNPSVAITAPFPPVPAGKQLFGSLDTFMGLDAEALLALTNTPSVYNYGRYAMANPLWDTPEKLLRVMGARMGWNMLTAWT